MTANQAGLEFLKIPFGAGGSEHVAGVDAELRKYRRQFVHEGDVEIALRVLDHLGSLSHLDRRRAVYAGGDHRAVQAPVAQAPAAAATTPVDPAEPAAMALGYVIDATKVDGAKFKTYSAGQLCSNCALFGAKAGEAAGPCPLFGGRPVAAKGWCSGYIKKAA